LWKSQIVNDETCTMGLDKREKKVTASVVLTVVLRQVFVDLFQEPFFGKKLVRLVRLSSPLESVRKRNGCRAEIGC